MPSAVNLHLIMFLGRAPSEKMSAVEREFDGVVWRAARATLTQARDCGRFDRLIIVTSETDFVAPDGIEVRHIPAQADFHLGRALVEAVADLPPDDGIVYVGGGAGSLLTQAEWQALADIINAPQDEVVTANNYFSADLVGWRPVKAITRLAQLPADDNNLAYLLCRKAGLPWHNWLPAGAARTIGTQFDYDTPTDAAIARSWLLQHGDRSELSDYLAIQCHSLERIPVASVLAELSRVEGEVLVAGRISGQLHRALETHSHGQTRVVSEERGLRASGREARGQAVSLLGFLLDELGPTRFFERLTQAASAAILDSRVLFAHQKILPSRADRFASDALQPDGITHPAVRALTEAALEVQTRRNFPILLGGHSAVAGGLLLLLDQLPPRYQS